MIKYLRNIKHRLIKISALAKTSADPTEALILRNLSTIFSVNKKHYCGRNTKLKGKGLIDVKESLDIGITGLHDIYKGDQTIVSCDGKLIIDGYVSIGKGTRIFIKEGKEFSIGGNSYITGRSTITVNNGIAIGRNCALAWNITIIDDDYHDLFMEMEKRNSRTSPIKIGDNVWIGCNVTILKGVTIADGTVVASNAVVTKSNVEKNVLIAGNPAIIVRRNIQWTR